MDWSTLLVLLVTAAAMLVICRLGTRRHIAPPQEYSTERLPPGATVQKGQVEDARSFLEAVTRGPVRPFATFGSGREKNTACVSALASKRDAPAIVADLRGQLGPGIVAFVGSMNWYAEDKPRGAEVVIGPGTNQFDILHLAGTSGVNYDVSTEDLSGRLKSYDREFGIDIVHAGTDSVEFKILGEPPDWTRLANDLYDLCPDTVDQGVDSIEELERRIRESRKVFLWWD